MSPVMYDDQRQEMVILDDTCCGEPMNDTGCDAIGCFGYVCQECGEGCDLEHYPVGGHCATMNANESDEDYRLRLNRHREAFGLSPLAELVD
jgi:hypothetical protein